MKSQTVYLDNAAATPMDDEVFEAMRPYFSDKYFNPSATYLAAKSVAKDIEENRSEVARHLGARSNEIIFTAGGTEANNLAIKGVMEAFPGANVLVSSIEHESVIKPAELYDHKFIKVKNNGLLDLSDLEKQINDKTVLVSVMYANNEIGTIQPIVQISKIIKKVELNRKKNSNDLPLYFHIDACQAPSYLDLHVNRLGVDSMTINSGKIYGPKQYGALFVSRKVKLEPQILGGGQEKGMRSGTENPANIAGLTKALNLVQHYKEHESKRMIDLQGYFINQLKLNIPNVLFNGSLIKRLPNNINIIIPGQDNELLLMKLDEFGIICASGSACNASSDEISPTLKAIGLTDEDAKSSLRFSMGKMTSKNDIDFVIEKIKTILE